MKSSCDKVKFIVRRDETKQVFPEQIAVCSAYSNKAPNKCRTFLGVLTERKRVITVDEWDYVLTNEELERIQDYYKNQYQINLKKAETQRQTMGIEL